MADSASSKDEGVQKRDLVISVGSFDGFRLKDGRLRLGWFSFASAARDAESQLERAVIEIDSLKAELDRLSSDHRRQLAAAQDETAALKAQIARASAEADQKLQRVLQENKDQSEQLSHVSSENARLQALMERVSSGVR